jgi:hypothetical protein
MQFIAACVGRIEVRLGESVDEIIDSAESEDIEAALSNKAGK